MSGKSQTIRDFAVSRPSQILPTNENTNHLGWSGTNRKRFYFPDASQISAENLGRSGNSKIPDRLGFSRHIKTRL